MGVYPDEIRQETMAGVETNMTRRHLLVINYIKLPKKCDTKHENCYKKCSAKKQQLTWWKIVTSYLFIISVSQKMSWNGSLLTDRKLTVKKQTHSPSYCCWVLDSPVRPTHFGIQTQWSFIPILFWGRVVVKAKENRNEIIWVRLPKWGSLTDYHKSYESLSM